MARKPRPMRRDGDPWAYLDFGYFRIGHHTLDLPEARRLRAWLDRAIEWMEERDAEEK